MSGETDDEGPDRVSEEPYQADEHVRALLAELGSGPDGETMPPAVATRLEDTLAQLVAERNRAASDATADDPTDVTSDAPPVDAPPEATVLPLHRRWVPRLTAAAAAVIVLGAGGVTAANLGVLGSGSTTSAQNSETAGSADDTSAEAKQASGIPEVSSLSFAEDVNTLLRRTALSTPEQRRAPGVPGDLDPLRSSGQEACPGPPTPDGAVSNPVRLDGRPAALLVHPERSGRQLVEAWSCAGDRRLTSVELTSP